MGYLAVNVKLQFIADFKYVEGNQSEIFSLLNIDLPFTNWLLTWRYAVFIPKDWWRELTTTHTVYTQAVSLSEYTRKISIFGVLKYLIRISYFLNWSLKLICFPPSSHIMVLLQYYAKAVETHISWTFVRKIFPIIGMDSIQHHSRANITIRDNKTSKGSFCTLLTYRIRWPQNRTYWSPSLFRSTW